MSENNFVRVLFEGEVESVSSFNDKGKFDILPMHTRFISLVQKEIIIRTSDGEEKILPLRDGVLKAEDNMINVFVGVRF